MQLNLPIIDQVSQCKRILIAGMGGGFDIFCGLPIYFALQQRGYDVHLANLTFSTLHKLTGGIRLTDTLLGVTASLHTDAGYAPELYLSQWFQEALKTDVTVWCFAQTGPRILANDYRVLLQHLDIDGIILIDGGVDSLLRGDETAIGSLLEDAISLTAVSELHEVPLRMLVCLGFGAEQHLSHCHILENIAELTQTAAFLGSCALTQQMTVYQLYEEAISFVHAKPQQDPSVINASIISAVQGKFGDYHLTTKTHGSQLWISPLMPLYWFFNATDVAKQNLLVPRLRSVDNYYDAMRELMQLRQRQQLRQDAVIPLS